MNLCVRGGSAMFKQAQHTIRPTHKSETTIYKNQTLFRRSVCRFVYRVCFEVAMANAFFGVLAFRWLERNPCLCLASGD